MPSQLDSTATLPEQPSSAGSDGAAFNRWYWLFLFWFCAALIMASHRPSNFLQPQFWAEDGHVWYEQAYQEGLLRPMLHTQAGYIQTFPRIVADVTLLVPLHIAPLLMNIVSALIGGLPAVFLLSSRAAGWASFRVRVAMALMYLCLPNSAEWHGTVTNCMWVFALLVPMVLLAQQPRGWPGRAFDLAVITLGGLTGPFALLLAPVAWAMAWYRRAGWRTIYAALITALAVVQGLAVVATGGRAHQTLGASFGVLANILGVRIFLSSLIGTTVRFMSPPGPIVFPAMITLAALLLIGVALWRSSLELKLFAFFCLEMLAAELRAPLINSSRPPWPELLLIGGSRYYLFPMLAFLLCLGHLALRAPSRWLRVVCIVLLCAFPLGAVRDWLDYAHGNDLGYYDTFRAEVQRFEDAPSGTTVTMRTEPARHWVMNLTKH